MPLLQCVTISTLIQIEPWKVIHTLRRISHPRLQPMKEQWFQPNQFHGMPTFNSWQFVPDSNITEKSDPQSEKQFWPKNTTESGMVIDLTPALINACISIRSNLDIFSITINLMDSFGDGTLLWFPTELGRFGIVTSSWRLRKSLRVQYSHARSDRRNLFAFSKTITELCTGPLERCTSAQLSRQKPQCWIYCCESGVSKLRMRTAAFSCMSINIILADLKGETKAKSISFYRGEMLNFALLATSSLGFLRDPIWLPYRETLRQYFQSNSQS
jgi:hypothetical protein